MSTNYAKRQPLDGNGNVYTNSPPPFTAFQRFSEENASVSSVVTLTDNTTVVEVAAVGQAAVVKWIAASDTIASVISAEGTANYDVIIPSGMLRRLVVPQETAGTSSIVGLNKQAGLYNRIAYKTVGIGSVLTAEY